MNNWKKCSLGQVVTFASGSSFSEKYQGMKNEEYDFYKVSDMNTYENNKFMITAENTIGKETSRKIKAKIHPKHTVIFPKVGAALLTNKRRITTKDSIFDNNIMGLIATEEIDYLFLYYFMSSVDLGKYVQTGAIPSVNNTIVENIMVQLPPMVEQQKIAEILSSVDAAIEKTEQVIAKTEEVKKGLVQQLLTKGIGHTEFKQTEIGEIPVDWKVQILGDISTITRLAGAEYTEYWNPIEDGNIIALRGYNIGRNKLILDNVEKISEDLSNKLYRSKLFIDDIVFPCVGTIGKAAVIYEDNKFHINQNIAKITPNPNIKSEYLVHYLMSDNIRSEILKYNTSTSQPNVLVGNLRKFKIIVPSVDEQQMIASILNNYDKKIDIEFKKLEVLKDLKRGLMQQLLTGQVRVKVY